MSLDQNHIAGNLQDHFKKNLLLQSIRGITVEDTYLDMLPDGGGDDINEARGNQDIF